MRYYFSVCEPITVRLRRYENPGLTTCDKVAYNLNLVLFGRQVEPHRFLQATRAISNFLLYVPEEVEDADLNTHAYEQLMECFAEFSLSSSPAVEQSVIACRSWLRKIAFEGSAQRAFFVSDLNTGRGASFYARVWTDRDPSRS